MRLHEHPDFATFVTAAANAAELQESFVEKDYWITEILRVIAATLPERAMFKGGTSLSKGWGLLDRFSEDVDLFVNPSVDPPLSGNQIDKVLKGLRDDDRRVRPDGHVPVRAGVRRPARVPSDRSPRARRAERSAPN